MEEYGGDLEFYSARILLRALRAHEWIILGKRQKRVYPSKLVWRE